MCWEARATPAVLRILIARAGQGSRKAARLLANVADRSAASELRGAAAHDDARVRSAAIGSLGWSGLAQDVELLATALGDPESSVRRSARAALAELGGPGAAEALARNLMEVAGEEHLEVVQALAWLRDPRALHTARQLACAGLRARPYTGRPGWRNSVWAAVRLGEPTLRRRLLEQTIDLAEGVQDIDLRNPSSALTEARNAYANLTLALRLEYPQEADDALEALWEAAPTQAAAVSGRHRPVAPAASSSVALEPLERRSVARLSLAALEEQNSHSQDAFPQAKFGGQPDWVCTPAWPLGPEDRPMQFYAQLPLLGEPRRIAYVFVSADENEHTFRALSSGNAVTIQPGGPAHLPTAPMSEGPALYETPEVSGGLQRLMRMRPYERYVRLQEGADPPAWSWPEPPEGAQRRDQHGDWNKIGGTPQWLQGAEEPPGEGWRFAFQFSAGWAGRELGDGAECYGFVREDGTGALLWQCH